MKYSDIYNRIADTYITSKHQHQLQHKPKAVNKEQQRRILPISIASLVIVFAIGFALFAIIPRNSRIAPEKKSLSLFGNLLPLKLEYEFASSPEKIKGITLDLPQLNLADYDTLEFAMRGDKAKGFSSLIKVELESKRREKKSFYLRGVQANWKTFKFPLKELVSLNSFSDLSHLSFIIEGWNADNEKGKIFIDKIVFTKNEKPQMITR
jgi:hypothetical protein